MWFRDKILPNLYGPNVNILCFLSGLQVQVLSDKDCTTSLIGDIWHVKL